jgi:TRAP-type C4-dicarboxylate transport system substrate-binding protein
MSARLYYGKIVIAAGFAAMAATTAVHAAEKWTLFSVLPSTNFQVKNASAFAAAVEKATEGEVVITVHPGGGLGFKGPELLAAVRDGLVDAADIQMNQQVGEDPFFGIESLPFLATGYDELKRLQEITRPHFDEIATKFNQKILYITPWPPQNVFSKVAVTNDIDQFKSLTIRTIDKNATNFFVKLGAKPVQMPWGEVVPALASGVLNAVSTSSTSAVDGRFWEFIDEYNQIRWQMNSQMVTVNLDAWKRLKPEHQKTIEELAATMQEEFRQASIAEDEKNSELLRTNGMKINVPTDELKAQLSEIGKGFWQDYAKSVGPRAEAVFTDYLTTTTDQK